MIYLRWNPDDTEDEKPKGYDFIKREKVGDKEMMTVDDYKTMLVVAQEGGKYGVMATHDILEDIAQNHMKRSLSKYYRKATVGRLGEEDMNQIFLIAVSEAIKVARVDVGNPMLFLIKKGQWAVVDELRKGYRRAIRQWCHGCEEETRIYELAGTAICPKCKGSKVERMQVDNLDDGTLSYAVESESLPIEIKVTSEIYVRMFRDELTGRTQEVFDKIIYGGMDRDACQNYIKEIAADMGVTSANVNNRLRKIKLAWEQFTTAMAELGYGEEL